MKTAQKKASPDRLSKLSTMLSELSDKELAMIEAMVNSRSKEVAEEPEQEISIEEILKTEDGRNLLDLLKQLHKTEIVFQLSQVQSFDAPINISWRIDEVEFQPEIQDDGDLSALANYVMEYLLDHVDASRGGDLNNCNSLPTHVRQELDKEYKKMDAAIETLRNKRHSFSLNELPDLQQIGAIFSFQTLEFEEVGSGCASRRAGDATDVGFCPTLELKAKGKRKILDSWCGLEDVLVEAYHDGSLEEDLPADIEAQIKAVDALQAKIVKLANALAKKHDWDMPTLLQESCEICQG